MSSLKKVLVTGATGQIGYMTYKRLLKQPDRYDPYALDCKRERSERVPKSWTLEIPDDKFQLCNISDFEQVRQAVEGVEVVAHLAADSGQRRLGESAEQ